MMLRCSSFTRTMQLSVPKIVNFSQELQRFHSKDFADLCVLEVDGKSLIQKLNNSNKSYSSRKSRNEGIHEGLQFHFMFSSIHFIFHFILNIIMCHFTFV